MLVHVLRQRLRWNFAELSTTVEGASCFAGEVLPEPVCRGGFAEASLPTGGFAEERFCQSGFAGEDLPTGFAKGRYCRTEFAEEYLQYLPTF